MCESTRWMEARVFQARAPAPVARHMDTNTPPTRAGVGEAPQRLPHARTRLHHVQQPAASCALPVVIIVLVESGPAAVGWAVAEVWGAVHRRAGAASGVGWWRPPFPSSVLRCGVRRAHTGAASGVGRWRPLFPTPVLRYGAQRAHSGAASGETLWGPQRSAVQHPPVWHRDPEGQNVVRGAADLAVLQQHIHHRAHLLPAVHRRKVRLQGEGGGSGYASLPSTAGSTHAHTHAHAHAHTHTCHALGQGASADRARGEAPVAHMRGGWGSCATVQRRTALLATDWLAARRPGEWERDGVNDTGGSRAALTAPGWGLSLSRCPTWCRE